MRSPRVHPKADEEGLGAVDWYDEQSPGLGREFIDEINTSLLALCESPGIWPRRHGYSFYLVEQFPYLIWYLHDESYVWVYAIAHAKRRPFYWLGRSFAGRRIGDDDASDSAFRG